MPSPELYFRGAARTDIADSAAGIEAAVFGRAALGDLDGVAYRSPVERKAAERQFLSQWAGLPEDRVLMLEQVHGFDCVRVTGLDVPSPRPVYATADAFFTMESDVLLAVRTADCLPIFFFAAGPTPVCGVLHAGWRGLARGIIRHTMGMLHHTMQRSGVQVDALTLHVFPGPYIPGSVYEVGPEVACRFPLTKATGGGKSLLDLYANARCLLGEQLRTVPLSFDDPFDVVESGEALRDRFYSHRRGDAGRNLNVIRLRGR